MHSMFDIFGATVHRESVTSNVPLYLLADLLIRKQPLECSECWARQVQLSMVALSCQFSRYSVCAVNSNTRNNGTATPMLQCEKCRCSVRTLTSLPTGGLGQAT